MYLIVINSNLEIYEAAETKNQEFWKNTKVIIYNQLAQTNFFFVF